MEDIWKKRGTIGVGTLHIIRGGHLTYLLDDKNNWGVEPHNIRGESLKGVWKMYGKKKLLLL